MAKSEQLVTVSIGPLHGRAMMITCYLDNMQSVLQTLEIEARENCDEDRETLVLGLLQLSQNQFYAAKKELALLKDMLADAAMTPAERGV